MLIISENEATRLENMGIKVNRLILGCLEDERLQKLLEELHINYGQITQEEINFLQTMPAFANLETIGSNIFKRVWGRRQGGHEARIEINGNHCTLLAGSKLKKDAAPYLSNNPKFLNYKNKREKFLAAHAQEIEKHDDKELFFTLKNNVTIESPVLACVVVDGLQDNGKGWQDNNGLTIEEWRTQ